MMESTSMPLLRVDRPLASCSPSMKAAYPIVDPLVKWKRPMGARPFGACVTSVSRFVARDVPGDTGILPRASDLFPILPCAWLETIQPPGGPPFPLRSRKLPDSRHLSDRFPTRSAVGSIWREDCRSLVGTSREATMTRGIHWSTVWSALLWGMALGCSSEVTLPESSSQEAMETPSGASSSPSGGSGARTGEDVATSSPLEGTGGVAESPSEGTTPFPDPDVVREGTPPSEGVGTRVGAIAPDFLLSDCNIPTLPEIRLYDFYGYAILLSVGTGWCIPCNEEAPELQALYQERGDEGFVILQGMFQDFQSRPADENFCHTWVEMYGLTFPVMPDPLAQLWNGYNEVNELPLAIVIDRDMRIVGKVAGPDFVAIENLVEAAISQEIRE
ncbi:MAG: TlpA family protein disulfide reductase [Deltaproteobacteria bacterium]|nr:MAG: TlpA family protein disulfide reductase [Deltaproteobacteria bacterium]